LVCNQRACALDGIATESRMASRASVHFCRRLDNIHGRAVIPYSPCGLRTYRLRRISSTATPWLGYEGRERRTKWQKISYLNIPKNLPQNVNCYANLSAVILTRFFSFANPRQASLPILPRRSILKALPICSQNSRLQEKSVRKQKAGSNCFIIQRWSTKRPSKHIVTFVAGYRECSPLRVSRLKRKLITNNFQIFIWTYDFLSA